MGHPGRCCFPRVFDLWIIWAKRRSVPWIQLGQMDGGDATGDVLMTFPRLWCIKHLWFHMGFTKKEVRFLYIWLSENLTMLLSMIMFKSTYMSEDEEMVPCCCPGHPLGEHINGNGSSRWLHVQMWSATTPSLQVTQQKTEVKCLIWLDLC